MIEVQYQKSEYTGCNNCKHTNVDAREYPCNECKHAIVTFDHYKPMTNADRIRNMSDEELAEFLANMQKFAIKRKADSKEEILRMLQAEVKEDGSNAG